MGCVQLSISRETELKGIERASTSGLDLKGVVDVSGMRVLMEYEYVCFSLRESADQIDITKRKPW